MNIFYLSKKNSFFSNFIININTKNMKELVIIELFNKAF